MPVKTKIADPLAKVTVDLPLGDALYLARSGVAAASKDDVTPVITGVLLSAEDGVVKALSTDRYRVHRATLAVEGVGSFPPFLVPEKALRWLIANASFFGRGFLPPTVRWEFNPTEEVAPSATGSGTPAPGGTVTTWILESGSDELGHLSHRTNLIAGNFPSGVEKLMDDALAAEAVSGDQGTLNLDFLAGCRALASYRGEMPKVRFVAGANPSKSGQALVIYRQGVALIQKGNDL